MERLTVNDLNKVCYDPWELCGMDSYCTKKCHEEGGCTKDCHILKMYHKLAYYEDLLPCMVGDKIYYIVRGGRKDIIKSTKVIQIIIKHSIKIQCEKGVTLKPSQIFLIYEEAEQALKEMENC